MLFYANCSDVFDEKINKINELNLKLVTENPCVGLCIDRSDGGTPLSRKSQPSCLEFIESKPFSSHALSSI